MFDLKVGIEELRRSRTLKYILATVLSVGNFLNGSEVTGLCILVLENIFAVFAGTQSGMDRPSH